MTISGVNGIIGTNANRTLYFVLGSGSSVYFELRNEYETKEKFYIQKEDLRRIVKFLDEVDSSESDA